MHICVYLRAGMLYRWLLGNGESAGKKSGINRLTEAFQESQQAMRYLMADTRKKLFLSEYREVVF